MWPLGFWRSEKARSLDRSGSDACRCGAVPRENGSSNRPGLRPRQLATPRGPRRLCTRSSQGGPGMGGAPRRQGRVRRGPALLTRQTRAKTWLATSAESTRSSFLAKTLGSKLLSLNSRSRNQNCWMGCSRIVVPAVLTHAGVPMCQMRCPAHFSFSDIPGSPAKFRASWAREGRGERTSSRDFRIRGSKTEMCPTPVGRSACVYRGRRACYNAKPS